VDGTVAANAKPYKYFIVLYFWHALERENVDNENQYPDGIEDAGWRPLQTSLTE
jgi:hypothetical protein